MKILFISKDMMAANVAYLLKKEGHIVKLYIHNKTARNNFGRLIDKTDDWIKEKKWVGKDGLIIFDDVGFGREQDELRSEGYIVFGGSEMGEKLETNRLFGYKTFSKCGLDTVPLHNFKNPANAKRFVERNPNRWVVKMNHGKSVFAYVGKYEDGRDVSSVLSNYTSNKKLENEITTIQEYIDGVEIGIGRYFNGKNWVGPIEMNIEHPYLFPYNRGPHINEMGTLAWYDDNENNKLFNKTLKLIEPFLKKSNFRGDFEINCVANKKGVFPIEATCRFGSPIIHLHSELHDSPWGEFLYAIAKGEDYKLKWKKGLGIVTTVVTPPFPYNDVHSNESTFGMEVFLHKLNEEEMKHVHFEELSLNSNGEYIISDNCGYILHVTSISSSIKSVQKKLDNILQKIHIPKMFYRNDIGTKFIKEDKKKLEEWGYL